MLCVVVSVQQRAVTSVFSVLCTVICSVLRIVMGSV